MEIVGLNVRVNGEWNHFYANRHGDNNYYASIRDALRNINPTPLPDYINWTWDNGRVFIEAEAQEEVMTTTRTHRSGTVIGGDLSPILTLEDAGIRPDKVYDAVPERAWGNLEADSEIKPVLFEFANIIKKNIHYGNPHGIEMQPEREPDTFTIYFWSANGVVGSAKMPEAFGIPLNAGQRSAFRISDEEYTNGTILEDMNGVHVAQVLDNTMFVFFDLPHKESAKDNNHAALMRALMELYIASTDPKEMEMRSNKAALLAKSKVSEVLGTVLTRPIQKETDKLNSELESIERYLGQYQQAINEYARKYAKTIFEMNAIESKKLNKDKLVERELLSIMTIKGVKDVTTRLGKLLRVTTEPIYISTPVAKYLIGSFAIEFGGTDALKITNLDNRINTTSYRELLDHPHIRRGLPCLGNMSDIMKLVYAGDIAVCVAMVMEFLNSYEPKGAYAQADNWEKVEDLVKPTAVGTPSDVIATDTPDVFPNLDISDNDHDDDDGDDDE